MQSALFQYSSSIVQWSASVKKEYGGICGWPGCTATKGCGAAHMFSRNVRDLRLAVENGVWLCNRHHRILDEAKRDDRFKIIELLVGFERYLKLNEVYVQSRVPHQVSVEPVKQKDFEL
jgi:hypothetical protein